MQGRPRRVDFTQPTQQLAGASGLGQSHGYDLVVPEAELT